MNDKTIDLQYTAEKCMELSKYSYELVVGTRKGKAKDYFVIDTEWLIKRFTHISGLEHINDVADFYISDKDNSTTKENIRYSAFEKIKLGKITFETIKNESKIFYSEKGYYKLNGPENPNTNKAYTIMDRIVELNNIGEYFDNARRGVVYKWENKRSNALATSNIEAEYVIAIKRGLSSNNENFYIFIDEDITDIRKNQKQKGTEPKKRYMRIVTAFPGNSNLVAGLRTVYTVLREDKINLLSKKCEDSHTHKNYKQSSAANAKTTTEYMTINSETNPSNIKNQGGVAVIDNTHLSINGQADFPLLGKIKQFFTEKIPQAFDIIKLKNEISELKEYISKREDQLDNALNEIEDNKQLLDEVSKENASLKEENSALTERIKQLEQQKQPVLTANRSKGSFLDNLPGFADKVRAENVAKSQQQSKPDLQTNSI